MPYVEYSSKQVDPLMERDEVLSNVGVHQAQWRLLRKRYSIRVEFEQTGSLGMCKHVRSNDTINLLSVYEYMYSVYLDYGCIHEA